MPISSGGERQRESRGQNNYYNNENITIKTTSKTQKLNVCNIFLVTILLANLIQV
jgi:hypothetical protein